MVTTPGCTREADAASRVLASHRKMRRQCALAIVLSAVPMVSGGTDVRTIIQRSVVANQHDWEVAPEYCYVERDREKNGTKTYRVLMLEGSPYEYLLKVNGKALSPDERENEREKLLEAMQQRASETPQEREERVAKYRKERLRDHQMMDQLPEAFDFKLLGKQKLDGFDVYVLSASPRPGYQPPNIETKALTGMQGTLWIDAKTFQWVKVEAQVVRPVSVEGFLARVEPGTRFELEKMPVANGVWFPKHFSMKSRARIFFFFTRTGQEDASYSDYQKGNSLQDIGTPPAAGASGGR
jgi:hypothetical protein